jgi:acetylornithine deacetylase/succinyl-diaminopimelate desuccinylase-like protein
MRSGRNCLFCAGFGALLAILGILIFAPALPAQVPGIGQPVVTQANSGPGDSSALAREATTWLAELIKINTTNPPGNEEATAKYIAGILQKEGIKAELLQMAPGRSALVARLNASGFPDPSKALLLVAHMDVVGVERAKWTVDPFAAVPKDGYIYGRGAIDDKGMLAANLAAFVHLKRTNARLNRDVIFLATDDEEGFGDASMKNLIAKYWDKIAAKYSLNEGGNVFMKDGKVQYVAVQASEKVAMNVTATAKGTPGHASIPLKDNAVTHLAAAVEKIGNYQAPVHLTTIVRRYFEGIAPLEDPEVAKWIRSIETPDRGEHANRVLADTNPMWNAMMRDTISPTMLNTGVRPNVIPSEATATLNVRLLPGNTITALLADLNKLVNDPAVKLEVQKDAGLAAPDSSLDSDFYQAIVKAAAEEFGGVPVLPFQSTWATDSAQLRLHNVQSYGLVPFPLTAEDLKGMHGADERIQAASFAKGVNLMVRLLNGFATSR